MSSSFTYDWTDKIILLVEDEPICCLFFQSALRNTDSLLLLAHNGQEAVSMIQEHPEIDLVLMDIKLPVMDGLEASRQIKKIRPELPIIIQTAYSLNNERRKAIEAGCEDYFVKPIKIEVLLEKIEHIFMTN